MYVYIKKKKNFSNSTPNPYLAVRPSTQRTYLWSICDFYGNKPTPIIYIANRCLLYGLEKAFTHTKAHWELISNLLLLLN